MTSKLALLCCFIALTCSVTQVLCLAGGEDVKPEEYPYYVGIYRQGSGKFLKLICGGAILKNQWILTSASCIGQSTYSYVREDIKKGNHYVIKAGTIHRNFKLEPLDEYEQTIPVIDAFIPKSARYIKDDIGLLKLKNPLKFNNFVAPVDLPKKYDVPEGEGIVTGLGAIGSRKINDSPPSDVLQYLTMTIMNDNKKCYQTMELADYIEFNEGEMMTRFCSTRKSSVWNYVPLSSKVFGVCELDIGDPFVVKDEKRKKNVIVGVALDYIKLKSCEPTAMFTKVSYYIDWIENTIRQN